MENEYAGVAKSDCCIGMPKHQAKDVAQMIETTSVDEFLSMAPAA